MKLLTVTGLALLMLSLIACGQAAPETTTPPPTSVSPDHQVIIDDLAFNPQEITIKVGDTVTWTNKGSTSHTVTSWNTWIDENLVENTIVGETWDSGDIEPGESYSRTFDQLGTYDYVSLPLYHLEDFYHSKSGTVIVE